MHHVSRRWLTLQSSRIAPFTTTCRSLYYVHRPTLPLRVQWQTFTEEGIDQGGVAQEFFQEVLKELFQYPYNLFCETEEGTGLYWPSVAALDTGRREAFWCFGVLMGLAIHNGFTLPVQFPEMFYRRLLDFDCWDRGVERTIEWVREGWPSKSRGFQWLMDNPASEGMCRELLTILRVKIFAKLITLR